MSSTHAEGGKCPSDSSWAGLGDTIGPSGWRAVENCPEPKGGNGMPSGFQITTVWGQFIPSSLPTRKVKRARPERGEHKDGARTKLSVEDQTWSPTKERKGSRDTETGKKGKGTCISRGFLEEVVRKKKCTHPEWCFQGLTRSNLTGVWARDPLNARKEATLGRQIML